ncbi:MAG: hypothetical protein NUW23_08745 [Firmicutes bacterium]|nr:hypothetical protein [Bacillota bacterium]
MKGTALVVVVALLVVIVAQPAEGSAKTIITEHRLEDGRRLTVPYYVIGPESVYVETVTKTTRIVGDCLAPSSLEQSTRESGQTVSLLNRAINTTQLFIRGFADVVDATWDATVSGEANLRDPAARYEFWKERGIYEKYTARERQFLNRVVQPAIGVVLAGAAAAGVRLAAAAIAAGTSFGFAPVAVTLGLGWLIVTGYKAYRVLKHKAEVVKQRPLRPYGRYQHALLGTCLVAAAGAGASAMSVLHGTHLSTAILSSTAKDVVAAIGLNDATVPFASKALALRNVIASEGSKAALKIAGAGVTGAALMYAGSAGMVSLVNMWGIPEERTTTETETNKRSATLHEWGTAEVKMWFGLTK